MCQLAITRLQSRSKDGRPTTAHGALAAVLCRVCWMLRRFESVAGAYGAAALRKGDAQLTLDRIREPELTEGHRTQMATDNVAGEQQVKLTSGSRNQLHSLLQMQAEARSRWRSC